MDFHVVIPARYASSRLPAKPLAMIHGKSMIQRVYEQACQSGAKSVVIATDDERILKHAGDFAQVVMTSDSHQSGTDRIFEASEKMNIQSGEIIVNVQGDEPFIPPEIIAQVAKLLATPESVMSTLCTPISESKDVFNPNIVKTLFSRQKKAIYFSRASIPFDRDQQIKDISKNYYRHLGIYGFKKEFLEVFSKLPVSRLENIEKLEQLRALENDYPIEMDIAVTVPQAGVDTQEDLLKANDYAKTMES